MILSMLIAPLHLHAVADVALSSLPCLAGKCAELEGRTSKDMYAKFGLDIED
jgi:hypothetical protein